MNQQDSSLTMKAALENYWARIKAGDMGALPATLGLLALCIVFGFMSDVFLTPGNFANLLTQAASVTVIAMGLVFVLLLGEIDLSAGYASGVSGAVLVILITRHGQPWWLALIVSVIFGALLGFLIGTLVENNNLSPFNSWVLFVILGIAYIIVGLSKINSRRKAGLISELKKLWALKTTALLTIGALAVWALNLERSNNPKLVSLKGTPIVVPVILALLICGTFVLSRTAYGRHIYAVGGNAEAARRAGIDVKKIRISAFVICSAFAAVAGMLFASRQNSISPTTGGSSTLLYAVGAAVIGGTSLFGGKGRLRDAILGGLVVAVIDNGMGLLGYAAGIKFIVTGFVLLVSAGVDAVSRKGSSN